MPPHFQLAQEENDPAITRWESAIARWEQVQQTDETENGIVFYGSSSIRLWNSISDDMNPWPKIEHTTRKIRAIMDQHENAYFIAG